jgi:hypothetical protein
MTPPLTSQAATALAPAPKALPSSKLPYNPPTVTRLYTSPDTTTKPALNPYVNDPQGYLNADPS